MTPPSIPASVSSPTTFQQAQQAELDHAYRKHGRDPWARHEFWGVIDEEVTELKAAIMGDLPTEEVLKEAMQIACVCQRYAETGDRYRGPHPAVASYARTIPGSSPPPSPSTGSDTKELRDRANATHHCSPNMRLLVKQAADTIDELRAELERVKAERENMVHVGSRDAETIQRLSAELTALKAQSGREGLGDGLELAWGVIANAWGGDWSKAGGEWREAAERWRDTIWEPHCRARRSPTPAPKPQPEKETTGDPLTSITLDIMQRVNEARGPSPTQPPKAQTGLKWGCKWTEMEYAHPGGGKWLMLSPTGMYWLTLDRKMWAHLYDPDIGLYEESRRSEALSALEACATPPPDYIKPEVARAVEAIHRITQPKPPETPSPRPDFADEEARAIVQRYYSRGLAWEGPSLSMEIAASIRKAVERLPSLDEIAVAQDTFNTAVFVAQAQSIKGIVDCTGEKPVVRKVLGTLPVTKDGCLLGDSADVYTDVGGGLIEKARTGVKIAWLDGVTGEEGQCPAEECAATKEAAQESSREGRVGK